MAIRERRSAAPRIMNADNGAQEGAWPVAGSIKCLGLQMSCTGPPRKWMISSMKLKLATLLDNLQEFLG